MNFENRLSSNINTIFCYCSHANNNRTKDPVLNAQIVYNGLITDNGGEERYPDADKALLHYALEHYTFWQHLHPEYKPQLDQIGIFGENISSIGLTEDNLCIGDILALGTSKVQVTHGRDACQTMDNLFNSSSMSQEMHDNHKTGWFYRVLEEGYIKQGDPIVLLERPNPQWTIALVQSYRYQQRENTNAILTQLIALPYLSDNWKSIFIERLNQMN